MPGPPRKRDAERRRRNKDGIETTSVDLDSLIIGDVEIPTPPVRTHENVADEGETPNWQELAEPEWEWHNQAMLIWESAKRSGQAIFMEPSDWAALYILCEQVSRSLAPTPTVIGEDSDGKPIIRYMEVPMPGATLNAIIKMMGSLMFLEGDRRKARVELERKKRADAVAGGDGKVVDIAQSRAAAFRGA